MVDTLVQTSPVAAKLRPGRLGHAQGAAGLRIAERPIGGAISLAAREAGTVALAAALGWDLPREPRCVSVDGCEIVWTGPGRWLVFSDRHLEPDLRARAGALGSVADQSDSRLVLRLEGPKLRDVLAKGVAIDLHPRIFTVGMAAATPAAHIPALLWRPDEAGLVIATPRSFAGSLVEWLIESALMYGVEIT